MPNQKISDLTLSTIQSGDLVAIARAGANFSIDLSAFPTDEEGTFTPVFTNGGTVTYQTQVGTYVKIGKLVFVTINLDVNVLGTGSGSILVSGLPFTSANILSAHANVSTIFGAQWSVVRSDMVGFLKENKTEIDFFYNSGVAGTPRFLHSDLGPGGFSFSLTYRAA